jgi:hypothetical protein
MIENESTDIEITEVANVQIVLYRAGRQIRAIARLRGETPIVAIGAAPLGDSVADARVAAIARALYGLSRRLHAVRSTRSS